MKYNISLLTIKSNIECQHETSINDVLSFIDLENYPKNEPLFMKSEFIRDLSSTLRLIFQGMK